MSFKTLMETNIDLIDILLVHFDTSTQRYRI